MSEYVSVTTYCNNMTDITFVYCISLSHKNTVVFVFIIDLLFLKEEYLTKCKTHTL